MCECAVEASPSGDAAENPAGGTYQAAASTSEDDSSTSLWIALGVAAAVVVGAAITFAVLRTRRRRVEQPTAPGSPATPAYAPPQQYPPHGTPGSGQRD